MGCEAKLESKRGTDAIGTPTRQEKIGGQEERPVNCTVRTGCKAMIEAGVVYGQICRKEPRKSGREEQDLLAAKPGRGSVSLDRRGRGAEKKKR